MCHLFSPFGFLSKKRRKTPDFRHGDIRRTVSKRDELKRDTIDIWSPKTYKDI
jgi:hypothetical protein